MTQTAIIAKLKKVLALTTSPVEGEAQAAAAMLARLLTEHNLDIADLEQEGATSAPGIKEESHDLGKAAFKWKLNLADAIAEHYYCASVTNHTTKHVAFVGRPDNVESLRMLYSWLIDQIARIAAEERRKHQDATGEHIDPLRWQVGFGLGAVVRLKDRLKELDAAEATEATAALVIHHKAEISDYLEQTRGYRVDGQKTAAEKRADENWQEWLRERQEYEARMAALKASDPEAYYRERPWERPEEQEKRRKQEERRERRRERRRARAQAKRAEKGERYRFISEEEYRKIRQSRTARNAGHAAADRINLKPFLTGETPKEAKKLR